MRRLLSKLRSNSAKLTEKSNEPSPQQKKEPVSASTPIKDEPKIKEKQVEIPPKEEPKSEEPVATAPSAAPEATEPLPKSESQATIIPTMSATEAKPVTVVEAQNVKKYPVPQAYFE